jgi:hypothetical protein
MMTAPAMPLQDATGRRDEERPRCLIQVVKN